MLEDGHSDTTDSSPATVRRLEKPIPNIPIIMTSEAKLIDGDKPISSNDFLPQNSLEKMEKEDKEGSSSGQRKISGKGRPQSAPKQGGSKGDRKVSHEDDDEDEDEEYDELKVDKIEGIYNPADYASLNVGLNPEIKKLFEYISLYKLAPLTSATDVKLHPFIPDYYPSVGDIDAFIKVVEPRLKDDGLGIKVLDEPAPFQSDPSVLDLRLRALAKQSSAKTVVVKKVENLGKNTKVIENWIKDISDLHRSKPSPSVHYSKPMPDIDLLLQEWPPEFEELIKDLQLPGPEMNCDLATYVDIVCGILDIPVYKSRIHSLHMLFTLFTTMKQFSNQFSGGLNIKPDELLMGNSLRIMDDDGVGVAGGVDRLQIL